MNRIDHLVVAARTLAQGADFLRDLLGVEALSGGKHVAMGTHNLVMQLGEERYLEVIAIDPDAEPPERPRWFDLDRRQTSPASSSAPASISAPRLRSVATGWNGKSR